MKKGISMAVMILFSFYAMAQQASIKGKIQTKDGSPAADVNIILQSNKATTAAQDGSYVLRNIMPGKYQLKISFTGLQTIEKEVSLSANQVMELNFTILETARELDEVIVEARRRANEKALTIGKAPISAQDLPQAVSVIERRLIEDQQAQRLSDVLKNANGVYLATTRGSTQENFSARGYGLGSGNLFKDGVRINSGAMPETGSLERVEVLKGSAAILFGNVSAGGIVNMVTKQPKFQNGGEIMVRAGSYGLFKPSFDIYGPVSSKIAFRVNGSYETADSYRNFVHSTRYYVNPSILFKLGKKTDLLIQTDYLQHKFTPDFGIGSIANTQIPDVDRGAFFGAPWQYAKTQQASATATLRHSLNDKWKLNSTISYQDYSRDYYSIERIQAQANGDFFRPLNRTKNQEDYLSAQINFTGTFQTASLKHVLLAGMDVDYYNTTAYSFNQPTVYDTINILDPNKYVARTDIPVANAIRMVKTPTIRFGAYLQDLISVNKHLKVLVGLRWSIQEGRPASTTNLVNNVTTMGAVKTDKAFSPRVGVVYQPTERTSLFASYANSFVVNSGTDVYGNTLQPSLIDQYEIGIKNDLVKHRLTANLTVYRIINHNLAQTAQFLADGVTPNSNTAIKALTGQTASDGFEIDLISHPVKGLDITAGYSYNFIRYTRTPDVKGNFVEGERLQNSVGSTANASAFYSIKGWKFGAGIFYTGKRYAGFNNTKQQAQNYNRLFEVDGFVTVDLSAGYSWKKISLLAKLSNLTNTFNYYTHENYSINPIAPRQLMATVRYKW
ncbi:MAG: TonB-dependent siderophore receptor [Sediminibacterium sp.]